ncbi:hypothetical protein AC579_4533 [Pseudocercospora musae]|uniref:Methyltransferase domain-containing protein n=1 Tax=Pseudocercospora musae TaxID=113226 RepID=A0A139IU12_9PEZI|nr:hypothetical protein AC579_4533 [Pseudocercospora musae]
MFLVSSPVNNELPTCATPCSKYSHFCPDFITAVILQLRFGEIRPWPPLTHKTRPTLHIRTDREKEDAPHWQSDVDKVLQDRTRQMLETYSGIVPSNIVAHIKHAQQRAWDIAPFASVGAMMWLNSYLRLHISYDTVLDRANQHAGARSDQMHGFDIQSGFFDIGYDFYKDGNIFKAHFFHADILKDFSESELAPLTGQIDIIWCAKLIHLFDRANQPIMAARLVSLLKSRPGSMFLGSQNGYPGGNDVLIKEGSQRILPQSDRIFLGDAEQMKEIWAEVGEETGTKWEVDSRLLDLRTIGLHDDDGSPYKKFTGYNLQWTATMCWLFRREMLSGRPYPSDTCQDRRLGRVAPDFFQVLSSANDHMLHLGVSVLLSWQLSPVQSSRSASQPAFPFLA